MITVHIPARLSEFTNGKQILRAEGDTVDQVLKDLEKQYPGIKEQILDSRGQIHRSLLISVGDTNILFLDSLATRPGSKEIYIQTCLGGTAAAN